MGNSLTKYCNCSCNQKSDIDDKSELKSQTPVKNPKTGFAKVNVSTSLSSAGEVIVSSKAFRAAAEGQHQREQQDGLAVINEGQSEISETNLNNLVNINQGTILNVNQYSKSPNESVNQQVLNTSHSKEQNPVNPNTLKLFRSSSNLTNMSNSNFINNINNLNDCFLDKNLNNNGINYGWHQVEISKLISQEKLMSIDLDEIMFKGYLNKLVISHIFKNCSTNVEKFCILTKDKFNIFKTKENFLLMKKPQHSVNLSEIVNCQRIDFSVLKIPKLYGFFFLYIELRSLSEESTNENEDAIFKIIKREREGEFFVLFSNKESYVDEWVCTINYFIQLGRSNLRK